MEITIGSKIKIEINGQIRNFQIVSSSEVDVNNGKVSYLSPIGEAMLGRQVGQAISINLPNDKEIKGKILEIE